MEPTLDLGEVIILDDSPEDRAALVAIIQPYAKRIIELDSAQQAMRYLDQQPWSWQPSLIFIDLVLPNISGFDMCRRMRERFGQKRIPILVVTKMACGEDVLEAQLAGADCFVKKPLDPQVLMGAVTVAVDDARKPPGERKHTINYYL